MQINFRNQTINYVERENYWKAIERGEWGPSTFDVLDRYISPNKTFIDIGAWVGALSVYAAKLGATVHAVEADNKAYGELLTSIATNRLLDKVFYHELAVSNHNGMTEINSMTGDGLGNSESSLINRGEVGQRQVTICSTLPDFITGCHIKPKDICLIKIDTEGSELLIIPGAAEWLAKHKPTIYISFHPAWFPNLGADVKMLLNILYPIYTLTGVSEWGKVYTINDFIAAMHTSHEHSFILTAK